MSDGFGITLDSSESSAFKCSCSSSSSGREIWKLLSSSLVAAIEIRVHQQLLAYIKIFMTALSTIQSMDGELKYENLRGILFYFSFLAMNCKWKHSQFH
jgi:hypothetical protein